MKLSTRSRYGTRMILDMAQNYNGQPVQLGEIAKRQNISLKYLEQIIRPLKKANYIKSFRGSKGGHQLNKPPEEITVGEVVALLEGGASLTTCSKNPETCDRVDNCMTRYLWIEASNAMFERLSSITFADLLSLNKAECKDKFIERMSSQQEKVRKPST
jgi:Rrf2 family protein